MGFNVEIPYDQSKICHYYFLGNFTELNSTPKSEKITAHDKYSPWHHMFLLFNHYMTFSIPAKSTKSITVQVDTALGHIWSIIERSEAVF